MEFLITQKTKVKIGKKSLSQVQGLVLAMMAAIDGGDAKKMFSSIENLKNAMEEKEPFAERVAPFAVVLEDLENMVANSTNEIARAYKIAKIKELISSLEEDGAKQKPELEKVANVILSRIAPIPYIPGCELLALQGISDIVEQNSDIVLSDKALIDVLYGLGFEVRAEKDNNFFAVRWVLVNDDDYTFNHE